MLNFDEARYLAIQQGALDRAGDLRAAVRDALARGVRNVFFAGSGGAGILMLPAARLLQTGSTFPTFVEAPAELVRTGSAHLGDQSLVVIPSLSGTTAESVALAEYARAAGAVLLTLTGHPDSPLGRLADHDVTAFAEDDTSCETFYLQSLVIALAILAERGEADHAAAVLGELATLPDLLLAAKRAFEPRAAELAHVLAAGDYHVITGAGSSWPEAWYYGMCILEEMQWIRTRPVHAADFFHGTLELVEAGVSVLVLAGEDATRPLTDRVLDFLPRYTDTVSVLDAADVDLPGLSPRTRSLISPIVLAALLERVSAHLEVERDHPLTTRRYYKRVSY